MPEDSGSLRIACRMVCTDQWLVTHVDPSQSIAQLKQVLLERFSKDTSNTGKHQRSIPVSPHEARRRSLSPITFAAPVRKPQLVPSQHPTAGHSQQTGGEIDEDQSDSEDIQLDIAQVSNDARRYMYSARPSTSHTPDASRQTPLDAPDPAQESTTHVLLAFSTTQILEDRFSLQWYGLHQDELLELHPLSHSLVSLPRFSIDAYIAPYFAAKIWALRAIGHALEHCVRDVDIPRTSHQTDEDVADVSTRSPQVREKSKKKITLEWKARWAIVHQGVFSLCKERHDSHAAFAAPLASMMCIRDGTQFELPTRSSRRTPSGASPPSSNVSTWWRRGSRDVSTSLSSSLASSASALIGSPSGSGIADMWDVFARRGSRSGLEDSDCENEEALWIVLDMLNSESCSHVLRVLHRHAPPTCDSSFVPSHPPSRSAPSPIVFSTRTSSPISPPDVPTPGPASSYTFPPASSPTLRNPAAIPLVPTTSLHASHSSYPFPSSPSASLAPVGPATPVRHPQLRINTQAVVRGVPYPDWRLALVRKARRAGLGAVGRAMELVMFGDEDDEDEEEDEDELAIEWARRLSAMDTSPLDPVARSPSRPQSGRHFSDSAVPSVAPSSPEDAIDVSASAAPVPSDSDESEAEWDGWLDVTIAQRRQEQLASRTLQRTDTLETATPEDLRWGTGWAAQYDVTGLSTPAGSTPERDFADPWYSMHGRQCSGSEAEGDTEGDGSSMHSNDMMPNSRPASYYGYAPNTRGRRTQLIASLEQSGGRTLSSYSSADSLLKRTIRTAIGSSRKAKRASASSSEMSTNAEQLPPRSASASPPLSRPSMSSMRSVGSGRSRALSPLSAQVRDDNDHGREQPSRHPIPLPGMPMVPAGYTTFRHSALYGRSSRNASRPGSSQTEREKEESHAGLAHGESMQRLPVPMSMMMTTVSSTVSVGTTSAVSTPRWGD
ncbi:hypothetical protein BD413DRAFT_245799 [Trametes elegans]|nr:hypothetical protein BD413DRAFT_245799 [Trametes elegans]